MLSRQSLLVPVLVLALAALACLPAPLAAQGGKLGVVLAHDKDSSPEALAELAQALRKAGYLVAAPELPWSAKRLYTASFAEGLAEMDRAVRELRGGGAGLVAVGGTGLGGNAALSFAARYQGLAGAFCMAPSHTPERSPLKDSAASTLARAARLFADGQGDTLVSFSDPDLGRSHEAKASVYVSYFDPEGAAVMPRSASLIKPAAPLLWLAGASDPLFDLGPGYAYERAAPHPLSRYAVVDAASARAALLEWLRTLPRDPLAGMQAVTKPQK